MLSRIGWGELLVLFAVILLLFGPKRLPELAQALGKSLKLFKQGLKAGSQDEAGKTEDKPDQPA